MTLRIDNVDVQSWSVGTTAADYTVTGLTGSKNVKVSANDASGDLTVNYIVIDGTTTLQGENQINMNNAVWYGYCVPALVLPLIAMATLTLECAILVADLPIALQPLQYLQRQPRSIE